MSPVALDALIVAPLGRFLALRPEGDTGGVDALAAASVRAFAPFRAPLTEAQLARRRAGGLTPAQEARLVHWGYPHVMAGFRFHMTLTGKRLRHELPAIRAALGPVSPRVCRVRSWWRRCRSWARTRRDGSISCAASVSAGER